MVVEDITERRALEAAGPAGEQDGGGGARLRVAHDFNNLLSVVLSYSELLAEDLRGGRSMRADLEGDPRRRLAGGRADTPAPGLRAPAGDAAEDSLELREIVAAMERMLGESSVRTWS